MQLIKLIEQNPRFAEIKNAVEAAKAPAAVFGVSGITSALLGAALSDATGRQTLLVTDSDAAACTAAADLAALGVFAVSFCSRDYVFMDVESTSHDSEQERLFALGGIASGTARVICASAEAVCQRVLPPEELLERAFSLKQGDRIAHEPLLKKLSDAGYVRVDSVEGRGQFAARGGIVDVFPCACEQPVRLDFFGDSLDGIYSFDPVTQRRSVKLGEVYVTPAREVLLTGRAGELDAFARERLPEKLKAVARRDADLMENGVLPAATDRYMPLCYPEKATLLSYLSGCVTLLCESANVRERLKNVMRRQSDDLTSLSQAELLSPAMARYFNYSEPEFGSRLIYTESFAREVGSPLSAVVSLGSSPLARWGGELNQLTEDIKNYRETGCRVAVLAGTQRAAQALCSDLESQGIPALTSLLPDLSDTVCVSPITLSAGFMFASDGICVISGRREPQKQQKRASRVFGKQGRGIGSLSDLTVGDYVVHVNHGIGVFDGINTIDYRGTIKDYIKIKYRGGDIIYVPVTQLDMVSLYTSPSDKEEPALAKLNSGEWAKTKQRVYREARDMAKELIALYARRNKEKGVAFSPDGDWQRDFEERFQYDETDDQLRSVAEIKKDMERPSPMDRLLCGDVGVGKTEVAMRAAFKCVTDGYQCAVLVPTTILAWQHYNSFVQRFENFPVRVALLSRFSTPKQIKDAVKGIADGRVDIAIGTHRLLQKDIKFKRLGLLVIDEEQRFGVAHKEKLKENFSGVDTLTLSATPIPRTLSMAMSGIRDMSSIEEPPHGRQPVQTYVMEYDDALVADAIKRELSRGGQVYYLHNRIDTIDGCAVRLQQLVPEARIDVAHGRMDETTLSRVWQRVVDCECDVLVCTTIIETGVDIPNVNTLIVENADNMGLSQLYQLRGRVGRSARRAYAYFTFRRDGVLTDVASKRLSAIRDFTGFGSGIKIAMRDLQIRGAGSVLSARQSGHMQAVGYDMYVKILNDAVSDEKGAKTGEAPDCLVDVTLDAHIPESYIASLSDRIEIYKQIAAVESPESAAEVRAELRDRFGEPPRSVDDLIAVSLIRTTASALGFYEIKARDGKVFLYSDTLDIAAVRRLLKLRLRPINVCQTGKAYLCFTPESDESLTEALTALLSCFSECKKQADEAHAAASAQ